MVAHFVGNVDQQCIVGFVTEHVIYFLELVEVDEHGRERRSLTRGLCQGLPAQSEKFAAVCHSGQPILTRQTPFTFQYASQFFKKPDATQRQQQPHRCIEH